MSLKERWNIKSNFQLLTILIVFSITGLSSVKIGDPILSFFEINKESWLYYPFRIILVFPLYQILLIIYGWLFGQFAFFWKFEKKMLNKLGIKI